MARHGENIYLRKDGRYEGRYVIGKKKNGRTAFAYIYGRKYSEVKRRLIIAKGESVQKDRAAPAAYSKTTAVSWLNLWLEHYLGPGIKKSTYGIYRRQIDKYIIPIIGSQRLCEIDKSSLRLLYEEIQQRGGSLSTAQNVLRRFRCALLAAQDENLIETVPPLPFKKRAPLKKAPRFLSSTEQRQIESSLVDTAPKDLAVLLGLYTGIRVGECCALKWENIDFREHEISITHTYQRISSFEGAQKTMLYRSVPKTENAVRRIPMTRHLEKKLSKYKQTVSCRAEDFVFSSHSNPMEPRTLQYHMERLEERTQIKGIHFHTLRHTFATRCLETQMDIKTLSELLGHSSTQITLDWYCHSSNDRKRKLIQKLDPKAA